MTQTPDLEHPVDPSSPQKALRRVRLISWGLVALAGVALGITLLTQPQPGELPPAQVSGVPQIGGPFELTAHDGRTITHETFADQHTLVFFGYTHCPDFCPTVLQDVTLALDALGPKVEKVQTLFVTIDPERDTAAFLKDYMTHFHPSIVGLTGSAEQIKDMAKHYKVFYNKVTPEGAAEDEYLMDHSTLVYFLTPEGQLAHLFNHRDDSNKIAEIISAEL